MATTKTLTSKDHTQTLRHAFNDSDATIGVSGFLAGAVGRQVALVIASNVETWTFSENGSTLYVLTLTYTDSTRSTLQTAVRTS